MLTEFALRIRAPSLTRGSLYFHGPAFGEITH